MHGIMSLKYTLLSISCEADSASTNLKSTLILSFISLFLPSGAYPALCTMGNGSFPGVQLQVCDVNYPPLSSAEVKERVELYLCSLSLSLWGCMACLRSKFTLNFFLRYKKHGQFLPDQTASNVRRWYSARQNICKGAMNEIEYNYMGADKSLARPGRKQASISVRMA